MALPQAADISIDVLDALGRRAATVFQGRLGAGHHTFALDATVMRRVYVVRAIADGTMLTARVTVTR